MTTFRPQIIWMLSLLLCACCAQGQIAAIRSQFAHPPDRYKPGVYWYFMDGNMNAESIREDLEAMKRAGIGYAIFLEVNVGVPRGPVDFLSERWFSLFAYAVKEARRLGIALSLGIGPGWAGSGGPWVKGSQSMQLLVASETVISSGDTGTISLPVADPPPAFFGEDGLPADFKKARAAFYEDVAVLAFPEPAKKQRLENYQEKALFYRAPYSSGTVKPFLSTASPKETGIPLVDVVNLTDKMDRNGVLHWRPQKGKWVVMRFVSRNNGAITRPAPIPGLGFESDKMDTAALKVQLDAYVGKILRAIGPDKTTEPGGLKTLHIDSWEMSSQNWTQNFRDEFIKRRGYDPLSFYPVYYGYVLDSAQKSQRFLWDMRQTTQELIFENHAGYVKRYAQKRGMNLSIEPYDMDPTSDLDLGSIADVPMAEFWSKGYGFNTSYSVIEATSIGHIEGKTRIQSESFTADGDGWKQHPASMKNQGDWAFAAGITQFYFHTFENQFLPDSLKPGATMGPYGVHWDRSQTWWPMVDAYHRYLTRCQYVLQQGRAVADILYLTPEGCPNVFTPPPSALTGGDTIGDRRGFNFDGCTARQLMKAVVRDHRLVFPSGATYKVLVLPAVATMTPELLGQIERLTKAGAVVVGPRPAASPSLSGYPDCDVMVKGLGLKLWGEAGHSSDITWRPYGKGTIIDGGDVNRLDGMLYPDYTTVANILKKLGYAEDFVSDGPIRYTHRTNGGWDVYFVANKLNKPVDCPMQFRTVEGAPELWDAVTGKTTSLDEYQQGKQSTTIRLALQAYESRFIVFSADFSHKRIQGRTIIKSDTLVNLGTGWEVSFDPRWGGPAHIRFDTLEDWSQSREEGIKYYSGIAEYTKAFEYNGGSTGDLYLDLGDVKNMARVKLNGQTVSTLWTSPWRVDISSFLHKGANRLEIEVVNLWANRLIGDERSKGRRYTYTTARPYSADSPLLSSGLMGPVFIIKERKIQQ